MKKQIHLTFESEDEAMEMAEKYAGIVVHDIRWIDGQPHDIYHLWVEYFEDPRLKETWKDFVPIIVFFIALIVLIVLCSLCQC